MTDNKRVQLINPWTGAQPADRNMSWQDIERWAGDHVAPRDLDGWLSEARTAYDDDDGDQLGVMIIGS